MKLLVSFMIALSAVVALLALGLSQAVYAATPDLSVTCTNADGVTTTVSADMISIQDGTLTALQATQTNPKSVNTTVVGIFNSTNCIVTGKNIVLPPAR